MPPPPRRPNESPIPRIWYVSTSLIGLIGLVIVLLLLAPGQPRDSIPYSTFESYLRDGRVAEVTVADRYIQGRLKAPLPDVSAS